MSLSHRLLDLGFLAAETPRTPMHFSALMIFETPSDPAGFVARLRETWLDEVPLAPFDLVPVHDLQSGWLLPRLAAADRVDTAQHLHLATLGAGGGERALLALAERLHVVCLDRRRPLWEVHLITGFGERRFAMLVKIHHAIFDGHGGLRLFVESLEDAPGERLPAPFWARPSAAGAGHGGLVGPLEAVGLLARSARGLARNATVGARHVSRWLLGSDPVAPPAFSEPASILNGPSSGRRRLAHLVLPLPEIERCAAGHGASVNDVLLAACGGALRRYLEARNALPDRSLTALVPCSLRDAAGRLPAGNRLTFMPMPLGTDIAEHAGRVAAVRAGASEAKTRLGELGDPGAMQYGMLINAMATLPRLAHLPLPPITPANLVVTNLAGPRAPCHLGSAQMLEIYAHAPMSEGVGLNIALVSYAGEAFIGLTADPSLVDDVDELAGLLARTASALLDGPQPS
ncbi:MAG: wax ester/triacylglycerol synthase family O-acyltransferase [Pseudomonadales bacterium]|nr:wax ester/triacylglycerol synthase family O-acyltransferase [Pseudomonadales bacterium]NIX06744.1 wax ester/triacylglycerol synthase family O-acyltransferase [Pseudomonadales bacterium]